MRTSKAGRSSAVVGAVGGVAIMTLAFLYVSPRGGEAAHPTALLQDPRRDTTCLSLTDSSRLAAQNEALRARIRSCVSAADAARRQQAATEALRAMNRTLTIPLTIPESHDEQRLDNGSGGLGPTAFIFGSPFAGGFKRKAQIVEHGMPGLLVAVVVVDAQGDVIPASYSSLNIRDGVSCVWLHATGPNPADSYRVYVTHPAAGAGCSRSDPVVGAPLFVHATQGYGNRHDDYPAAARFGDDASGRQPLLGFKCLNAWCEAGPTAFAQRPPWTGAGGREGRVKGWHDEQWLAERIGGVWMKRVRATIVPSPRLDERDRDYYSGANTWRRVAVLQLHDSPAGTKYERWGLRQGPNIVEMNYSGTWRIRIRAPGVDAPIYWSNVEEMPHMDFPVPGSVRFRWTVGDDGIWVPCGQSCCRADGE